MYLPEGTWGNPIISCFSSKLPNTLKAVIERSREGKNCNVHAFYVTIIYTNYSILHMYLCECIYRYSCKYGDNTWKSIFESDMSFHVKFTFRDRVLVLECDKTKLIVLYFIKEFTLLSQVACSLQRSFKRNLFVLPGHQCLCLKFLMKLSQLETGMYSCVWKSRQHRSCVFICLGDLKAWKFHEETSDLDDSSTANSRRYCHSSMDLYRCLECSVGASFLCCLSLIHDSFGVRNATFTKAKNETPKSFHPSSKHAHLYKYNEILPLNTLGHLDLKSGEAATAAQASTGFRRSSEV